MFAACLMRNWPMGMSGTFMRTSSLGIAFGTSSIDCCAGTTTEALVNIASLLAQTMWESGGLAPFSACDENNYIGTSTSACTQRLDGEVYHTLIGGPHACAVTSDMFGPSAGNSGGYFLDANVFSALLLPQVC